MLQKNDLVEYTQLEMFDKALEGRKGIFQESFIKPFLSGEESYSTVLFFGIGFKDVPTICLSKVNN
jgi:hypothetical protein